MIEKTEIANPGGRETDLLVARLMGKGLTAMIILTLISMVQMHRHGIAIRHVMLASGSMLSIVILIAYPIVRKMENELRRETIDGNVSAKPTRIIVVNILGAIARRGGFIPYLFGGYLLCYEGLWRLRLLYHNFSSETLIVALLFIIGGYSVVSAISGVIEFCSAVEAGRVKVR